MALKFHRCVVLAVFISLMLLVCVSSNSEQQKQTEVRSAPRINLGGANVIDGAGKVSEFQIKDVEKVNEEKRSGGESRVSVSTVALFTLVMAAATGLGAVPFFFVELDPQWAGICNGMAAGVMLAASFDLIQEGQEHGAGSWVVIGILSGGVFIFLCKKVKALI